MLIGEIEGTVSTSEFKFRAYTEIKKFDFVAVKKQEQWILAQVQEVKKYEDGKTEAQTSIIGYREKGLLRRPKSAIKPNSMIYSASQELISETLGLDERGLYIGKLESNTHVKIHLDPESFYKHVAILAQTGSGKCVSGNTEILLDDGSLKTIRAIFKDSENNVIKNSEEEKLISLENVFVQSIDKNLKLKTSPASFAYRKKCDKILELRTASGRKIEVSEEHPLLTIQDEVQFKESRVLKKGDYIAIPRKTLVNSKNDLKIPESVLEQSNQINDLRKEAKKTYTKVMRLREEGFGAQRICNILGIPEKRKTIDNWIYEDDSPLNSSRGCILIHSKFSKAISYPTAMSPDLAEFLALSIAEGAEVDKTSFRIIFTNYDEKLLRRFSNLGMKLFGLKTGKFSDCARYIDSKSLKLFLECIGYEVNHKSREKNIPDCILKSDINCKKSFLRTFYDCEGCMENCAVTLSSASKDIANKIMYLLLNFKIVARLRKSFKKATNSNHSGNWYYEVSISGAGNLCKFSDRIGFSIKRKQEKLKSYVNNTKGNTNVDIIPHLGPEILRTRKENGLSQMELSKRIGMSDMIISRYELENRFPSREAVKKLKEVLPSKKISLLADSDIFWDQITEINEKTSDDGYVYDLTVDDTHTFIAGRGGIVSHNSYLAGVVCEELLDKNYPVLIIDPHGEYHSLGTKNKITKEQQEKFEVTPKSYKVVEFTGESSVNSEAQLLTFSEMNLKAQDIMDVLPSKLTNSQLGILYTILRELEGKNYSLDDILSFCTASESKAKWGLINLLELLRKSSLFSKNPTELKNLIKPGQATLINLKGVAPKTQEIIVHLLSKNLFYLRKRGEVSPFLMLIEEAHNFIPERNIGKAASSNTLMSIASEGRKFGLGLIVVSQRPARIDNNILSQCNTQVILRVTNPSDLNAISKSFEGVTKSVKGAIRGLPSGVGLVLGKDYPIMTEIRVRKTKHGGEMKVMTESTKMLKIFSPKYSKDYFEKKLRESMKEVYYPLWVITSGNLKLVLDGKNGELKFRSPNLSGGELELLNIVSLKPRTKNELIEKLSISFSDLSAMLDHLVSQKFVKRFLDGEKTFYSGKENPFANIGKVDAQNAKVLEIDYSRNNAVSRAKKVIKGEIDGADIIYYPYYATQKIVIDAITGKQI